MAVQSEPLQIFCSFATEDEALYNQLHSHLRLLEREGIVTLWHQHLITAGIDWAKTIDEQLTSASIILLLLSPAFFASDYCYGVEMQQAMQRHEAGTARVIPILLRPVDWTLAPFAHLAVLPSNRKSVAEWSNRDAAFTDVVMGLHRVIEEFAAGSVGNVSRKTVAGVWNVPYRRNPHFTGRDELLNQLQQQLSPEAQDHSMPLRRAALTQPQAIKGLGGIGKTQIAVEYAYRAQEQGHYIHTLWINAANEEALITSFAGLAELLPAFPSKGETDQRKLVVAIKRWLEECQQRWLLIFDNADDVSLIQEYLPPTGNGSILLTTRASAVGSLASSIEVEIMSFIEGTHLLLRRAQHFAQASDEEINEAGNIVIALDHFPLALDQAGAYIDETQCNLADYLTLYQNHRKELLARRGGQTTNYPDSVATTWSLSFQKVEQANPAAVELLRLCAFLAPDHIPEELFREGVACWTGPLQQAVTNPFAFNQMLEELLKFSLVKRLAKDNLLSIHRLVQAVQMEGIKPEEQRQWAERIVRAMNIVFPHHPKEDVTSWPQCLRYLEQAQACDVLIQEHIVVLPEAADLLERTATYLREHASYALAEPLYIHALSIREQHTANNLNDLATLYYSQGKYTEAERLYQRTIRIREEQMGGEHPQVAFSLSGLALLYQKQGKYVEAESLLQRSLQIHEQQLGPDHLEVAISLNGLAYLFEEQGKHAQAEPLYQRALHIREKMLGLEHPDVAASLNNLANLYWWQGKYAMAEPLLQQSLVIREQQLGPEHPDVANPLNNLANLYSTQSKYREAEPLYKRALAIKHSVLGEFHPDTASCMTNLAQNYLQQGRYADAEPLFNRALVIREQVLGPDHPNTAASLNELALLYTDQGREAEAEAFLQRTLLIREQAFGPHNHEVATSLNNLGDLYKNQGRYTEAEPLLLRALAIWERALGPDHPDTAISLHNLAEVYRERDKYVEALPLYQRAIAIWEQTLGPDHSHLAHALHGLAVLYREQGNLVESELLFLRALAIRENVLVSTHPDLAYTLHEFAILRQMQGHHTEACSLYKRALVARSQMLGVAHPNTMDTHELFVALLRSMGQIEEATQFNVIHAEEEKTRTEK